MERLSIDEIITDFEYDAKQNRVDLDISYAEKNEQVAKWLKELKAYRDAEEQGLLLRLPCKVGSELYVIRKLCDGKETRVIENVIANSFDLRALQRFVITSNGHRLNFSNFGKTVFLTKEEAEQKLKELQG